MTPAKIAFTLAATITVAALPARSGSINFVERRVVLHDGVGIVADLTAESPGFFSRLSDDGFGSFGWTLTNHRQSALENLWWFGFIDADIDRASNTFFNEYGELTSLTLPPGAPAGAIRATSWQIDEPGFVFGTIINDLQSGALRNRNFVPATSRDDVSLTLGFNIGSLQPGESATATFYLSRTALSGGLRQVDPDSDLSFYFNGFVLREAAAPDTGVPEPHSIALVGSGGLLLLYLRRYRN